MGLSIHLDIIPDRISDSAWREVYKESLVLVHNFPFMDRIISERDGIRYSYTKRTEHRANVYKGYSGWHTIGDMAAGPNTEDFILCEDVCAYRSKEYRKDNGADVLLHSLYQFDDVKGPDACIDIWGKKTQGEDSHIDLLAIACLIVDRLPQAAYVHGDISLGQCRRAIRRANQALERPVHLPVTAFKDRLLQRLRKDAISERWLLPVFMHLTAEYKGREMGDFLKREFSRETIYRYYTERFSHYSYDTIGFDRYFQEYLELGLDFQDLCMILVTDPDQPERRMPPERFLDAVVRSKLCVREKGSFNFEGTARKKQDGGEVDAYLPLETVRDCCEKVFGERCCVSEVLNGLLQPFLEKVPSLSSVG